MAAPGTDDEGILECNSLEDNRMAVGSVQSYKLMDIYVK